MKKIKFSIVFTVAIILWAFCIPFQSLAQDTVVPVKLRLKETPEYQRAQRYIDSIRSNHNDYIGIGSVKIGNDIAKANYSAKNQARSDLASKIKFTIQSTVRQVITNSASHNGKRYSEQIEKSFQEKTNLYTEQTLSDVETGPFFKNYPDSGYVTVVMYLNKKSYLEKIKKDLEAKKTVIRTEINLANNRYATGHYLQAVTDWIKASNKLNELFHGAPMQDKLGSNSVTQDVASYINGRLAFFFDGLLLENSLSGKAYYDAKGRLNKSILIYAKFKDENGREHPVPYLPLKTYFVEGTGNVVQGITTGEYGETQLRVNYINPANKRALIRVTVDTARIKELSQFPNLIIPTVNVPVQKVPTLALALTFHNNRQVLSPFGLKNKIQSEILNRGMAVIKVDVSDAVVNDADIQRVNQSHAGYFLYVYVNTLNSGTVGGYKNVYIAHCTATLYLYELPQGNLVATRQLNTSEGYGGSASGAAWDAFHALSKNILSKIQGIMEEIK